MHIYYVSTLQMFMDHRKYYFVRIKISLFGSVKSKYKTA